MVLYKIPYYIILVNVFTLHDPDIEVPCNLIAPADKEADSIRFEVFPISFVDVSVNSTLFAFQTVNTVPALAFVPEVATKSKNPAV